MTDFRPLVVDSLPAQDVADTIALACDYFMTLGWPQSVPRRSDVFPEHMVPFLSYVNLVGVIRDGETIVDFKYRLVGTAQVERAHIDVTGLTVMQAFEEPHKTEIFTNMQTCVEGPCIVRYRISLPHKDREHISSDRFYFPLRGASNRVDFILQVHAFD